MMPKVTIGLLFFLFISCVSQEKKQEEAIKHEVSPNKTVLEKDAEVLAYYNKNKGNYISSKSSEAVSNGKMTNGKLLPFYGENFTYFDKGSYTQTK